MTALIIIAFVVGAIVLAIVGVALWDVFVPKRCAGCGKRALRCLNFVRATPGPSYSTFRCAHCGEEFAQADGHMEARKGSRWEGAFGWGPAAPAGSADQTASGVETP